MMAVTVSTQGAYHIREGFSIMATAEINWPYTMVLYAYDADGTIVYRKSFAALFGNHLDYGVDERFPKRRGELERVARSFIRDLDRLGCWDAGVTAVVQVVGGCSPAENGCVAEIAYGAKTDGWFVYSVSATSMKEID